MTAVRAPFPRQISPLVPARAAALLIALFITLDAFSFDRPIVEPARRDSPGVHARPAVAGNGVDFFAAWEDGRARVYEPHTSPQPRHEWDVYGSRIGRDGRPDPVGGVPLNPSWLRDQSPTVVWNGSEYVVIRGAAGWDIRGRASEVIFTRITIGGPQRRRVIELPPLAVGEHSAQVAAAWNGSHYLVVIDSHSPGDPGASAVSGFVVDSELEVVTPFFQISLPGVPVAGASVVTDGDTFLVSWFEMPSAEVRVGRSAIETSSGGITHVPAPHESRTAAAWNGTHYLVTWSTEDAIRARFIDARGNPVSEVLTIAAAPGIAVFAPSIAWNGTMFLITFAYRNEWPTPASYPITNLYATRVAADGTLLDVPYPLTISTAPGEQTTSAVAASGSDFLVVYSSDGVIESVLVDPTVPKAHASSVVTRGLAVQSDGSGTSSEEGFAFLWTEQDDVLFGRTSRDGAPLDGAGRVLDRGSAQQIVSNGDMLLAVWKPEQELTSDPVSRAARISAEGEVLDDLPIELPQGADAVATDGLDFIVMLNAGDFAGSRLMTYTILANGVVSAAVALDASSAFPQEGLGIAWNGLHYLVVYRQYLGPICYRCPWDFESRAMLLDRSGHPVGAPFAIPFAGPVAASGGRFLVAASTWSSDEGYALKYLVLDEEGRTVAIRSIDLELPRLLHDVAASGNGFAIAAGDSLFEISAEGELLRELRDVTSPDVIEADLIDSAGTAPLLIRRLVKLDPGIHQGGIERLFLRFRDPGRSRAVGR